MIDALFTHPEFLIAFMALSVTAWLSLFYLADWARAFLRKRKDRPNGR